MDFKSEIDGSVTEAGLDSRQPMTPTQARARRARVFLVDDEVELTQLAGSLLSFNGMEVHSSNDPTAALSRLEGEDFDAVIMDLMMPRLDGHSLLRRLKAIPRHARTPVLVLSAKRLDDAERKELLASGVRFIPKPVSPTRLVQIVREVLK